MSVRTHIVYRMLSLFPHRSEVFSAGVALLIPFTVTLSSVSDVVFVECICAIQWIHLI